MTTILCVRVPAKNQATYQAAKAMMGCEPMTHREVFALADFGSIANQAAKLRRAIETGWMVELPGGQITLSQCARDHFDERTPAQKYQGSKAPQREIAPFKPMTAKHRPDTRGRRQDALDNSLAAMPSHYARVAS